MNKEQTQSIINYKKNGVSILEVEDNTVLIKQERLVNGYILNQKQLVEIAKSLYPLHKIKPVVYSLDLDIITVDWINEKIVEFGIKPNDLTKQLALEKTLLNSILSGEKGMSNSIKSLFFYYFLNYEINKNFREFLE